VLLAVYAALLASSYLYERGLTDPAPARGNARSIMLPAFGPGGPLADEDAVRVNILEWGDPGDTRPAVVLIHGSPGSADNFDALGPAIAADGRRVVAVDLPGFGASSLDAPSYAARAHAQYTLTALTMLRLPRVHVVGWSMGGVVALHMVDLLAPVQEDRIATVTLLAATAAQETEGSGDHHFEHAKYAIGVALEWSLANLVADFGRFESRSMRNFWDTDQRPVRGIMESLEIPALVLHGRHDPLVSDWAAERHHELIPTSRLIMTEHSHFLPFLQPEETAAYLEPFFARHDAPGVPAETGVLDLAPMPERPMMDALVRTTRNLHWITAAAICAGLARLRREAATALAGLLTAAAALDFGVAFLGLLVGRALHPREPWFRRDARWILGLPLWTAMALLVAQAAAGPFARTADVGPAGLAIFVIATAVLLNAVKLAPTRAGRRRIAATVRRFAHHEWWPTWLLYGLLVPHFARLAIRHRSPTVWTCVNPGIAPGGGVIGESKQGILRGFTDPRVLSQHVIGAGEADPISAARRLLEREPALGGYPLIVKPDAGQHGVGIFLVRTDEELVGALGRTPAPVLLQRFHPGPVEVGVFWTRDPGTVGRERVDAVQGRVFAVTRKIFPEVTGDGRSAVRDLILAHPRYRMQARVFLANGSLDPERIPADGERVRLSSIGNHVRGCRFEDGADLITPELEAAIDELARAWRGPAGEPFDFGRFDVRSESEESLKGATDLAVIELNGVTSEATGYYDPSWSALRALRLLARQWSIAFELGAARRAAGSEPMGVLALLRAVLTGR
jgi:pimeloyl-ACP methyl ester carboxylesterase